jgi:hypothetical protein
VQNWTGRPSIINWTTSLVFCAGNMVAGESVTRNNLFAIDPVETHIFWTERTWDGQNVAFRGRPGSLFPLFHLSFLLISIISLIYSNRDAGMFKML